MEWENVPESLDGLAGFVYRITCLPLNKFYIGKKLFTSSRKKKIACRTGGKIVQKGKKKTVRETKESDWKDYYGSSKELLLDLEKYGKEAFRREIIQLAPTKGILSYYELKHQLATDALWRDDAYNGIINVRLGRNVFPKGFTP
jgi:Putative endonuclease segE, GIY-YIG domain